MPRASAVSLGSLKQQGDPLALERDLRRGRVEFASIAMTCVDRMKDSAWRKAVADPGDGFRSGVRKPISHRSEHAMKLILGKAGRHHYDPGSSQPDRAVGMNVHEL